MPVQRQELPFAADVERSVETLSKGGIIIYPTDTIWGIGCDATRSDAVRRIFELKRRADSKALITLLGDVRLLDRYVDDVPEQAYDLIEFSTRPLTIIYDRGRNLAPELLAADGSVGIRVTADPFCREVMRRLRRPIVSTSANFSGEPSPSCFAEISAELLAGADYVVGWRRNEANGARPSSIMKLSAGGLFSIIRN